MAGNEHLMFARESSFGVWTTPTLALPVRTVSIAPESPLMIPSETGGGRGRRNGDPGEIGVTGDIVTSFYPTILPKLLRGVFGTRSKTSLTTVAITSNSVNAVATVVTTTTPHGLQTGQTVVIAGVTGSTPSINGSFVVTVLSPTTFSIPVITTVGGTGGTLQTGNRNKLLFEDDTAFDSFSLQKRYKSGVAESIRGAKITGITISARTKEFVEVTLSFVAKDATLNSLLWSDGTAAPAVVDPVPYPASIPEAFKFYQGQFSLGGTVVNTTGELVVTGGTPKTDFDNIEVEMNFNLGTDGYGVNLGERTVQTVDEGAREIMVRFDPNFDTEPSQFYTSWRAGTAGVLSLLLRAGTIAGAQPYEANIVMPQVKYASGALPELNAEYGLKRYTVEGQALTHPSLLKDLGMAIQTTDDLTV